MGFGVVVLEVLGGLVCLALLAGVGYAIGRQPAVDLVGVVADDTLWVTVILVVLVILGQFILGRRRAHDAW